jgi:GntR family transcriptional regulator, transcriptional repressor for pyruvate dehydrogenase complex
MRMHGPGSTEDLPPFSGGSELFRPVETGRMSGAIVEQIRDLIHRGQLQPGQRLPSERELAERFEVSRVTVRDALRALETMGLVEIRVGAAGGAFLTATSAAVVGEGIRNMLMTANVSPDEIAEVRLIVELGIVRLTIARATEQDIDDLRDLCRRAREALDANAYDTALSAEFHVRLARAAHNSAVEMVAPLFRGPLSMAPVRASEPSDLSHERSVTDHTELVDAIAARDLDAARRLMAKHLLRGTTDDSAFRGLIDQP